MFFALKIDIFYLNLQHIFHDQFSYFSILNLNIFAHMYSISGTCIWLSIFQLAIIALSGLFISFCIWLQLINMNSFYYECINVKYFLIAEHRYIKRQLFWPVYMCVQTASKFIFKFLHFYYIGDLFSVMNRCGIRFLSQLVCMS